MRQVSITRSATLFADKPLENARGHHLKHEQPHDITESERVTTSHRMVHWILAEVHAVPQAV